MSLQMRMSQTDERFYNPNRDIAHCFPEVAREVAARLEDERWPALTEYLKKHEISMDDLGEVCRAFCEFVASACEDPKEDVGKALTRAGWYKVPEQAQVALCAIIGTVMMGYFFTGAREATIGGEGPCSSLADLRVAGRKTHRLITSPRWKVFLRRVFCRKIKRK